MCNEIISFSNDFYKFYYQEEKISNNFPDNLDSKNQQLKSLEKIFFKAICYDIDIEGDTGSDSFDRIDYLIPNETTPKNIKPHLDKMCEGLIVSMGTERSFFDLLLSPKKKCTGLIIRDINPRVKAYADFLILLLRISKTRDEFVKLSQDPEREPGQDIYRSVNRKPLKYEIERLSNTKLWKDRVSSIKSKIYESDMPTELKEYYLRHLNAFAYIYFKNDNRDGNHLPYLSNNEGIEYRKDDALFFKLKEFAENGKIIATIGDINDLNFLKGRKIAVVDTSNIISYGKIHLKGIEESQPLVIWTRADLARETKYSSFKYIPLDSKEQTEFDRLLSIFAKAQHYISEDFDNKLKETATYSALLSFVQTYCPGLRDKTCIFYIKDVLKKLRNYSG